MSVQAHKAAGPKRARGTPDHAEIVRIAKVQAEAREAERQAMIASAAYFRAEQRGFEPGHELEDWLAAEAEVANLQVLSIVAPSESSKPGSRS